jgi:hypothetical protein
MLDPDLLAALEDRWRMAGVPYLDDLPPGLTDEDIDRQAAPLGFALPDEVRLWYRWHNGSSGDYVTEMRTITSLAHDVEFTLAFSDDPHWPRGWLKVMDEKPYVAFDCRGPADAPVPVWHYDHEYDLPTRPVFGSIGDLVAFWIELIDDGWMAWEINRAWYLNTPLPDELAQKIRGVP